MPLNSIANLGNKPVGIWLSLIGNAGFGRACKRGGRTSPRVYASATSGEEICKTCFVNPKIS